MNRHQRNAASRVGLGTLIVGIVLSLMALGMSPAQAADRTQPASGTGSARPAGKVFYRTTAPRWVNSPTTKKVDLPGTSNANVDWQWLRAGWEIKFNWAETRQMSRGFSYCTAIAALLPTGITQAVAASCGLLWVMADIGVSKGKCVSIFVPISLINTSAGYWSCSH